MKVSELVKELNLRVHSMNDDTEILGCYTGDLLSRVMSKAKKKDAWVTIMSNVNVAAVASLTEVACVIIADGVSPDGELIDKAKSNGINLFSSDEPAANIIIKIGKRI